MKAHSALKDVYRKLISKYSLLPTREIKKNNHVQHTTTSNVAPSLHRHPPNEESYGKTYQKAQD